MNSLSSYRQNLLRIILRRKKLSVPKVPKLKIKNNLEKYSNELQEYLNTIDFSGQSNIPDTTRDLLQSFHKSTMILKETEIDKDMIERIGWHQKMLIDPEDFSVWLTVWMEDQASLIKTTFNTLGDDD